jgi:hypothetical protein
MRRASATVFRKEPMAAYVCPDCDTAYPKETAYDNCPNCGTSTKYTSTRDPDQSTLRHIAFEKWCAEHWTPRDDVPLKFLFRQTPKDVKVACELIRQLDGRGILVSELIVVLPLA